MSNIILDILIGIVSTFIGVSVALWIERKRRPKLMISVDQAFDVRFHETMKRVRILRLRVTNQPLPKLLQHFYQSEPALNCIAHHHIYRTDGSLLFNDPIIARWTGNPQPETRSMGDTSLVWRAIDTRDIAAVSETALDVVVRHEDSSNAFPFINQSYTNSRYEVSELVIPPGTYWIKTTIDTGGRTFSNAFYLSNDGHFDHFRLDEIVDKKIRRHLGVDSL